jgi:tryptophanyl-tRNA synthetase
METVSSGIHRSGELQLGNDLGAVRTWVELQEKHRGSFCIVEDRAIAQPYHPERMGRRVRDMAADLIAGGFNPDRCALFVHGGCGVAQG